MGVTMIGARGRNARLTTQATRVRRRQASKTTNTKVTMKCRWTRTRDKEIQASNQWPARIHHDGAHCGGSAKTESTIQSESNILPLSNTHTHKTLLSLSFIRQ